MENFKEMNLCPELMRAIDDLSYVTPTPIQAKIIPVLLSRPSDVMGLAQTGTGKTAAYGLPLLQTLEKGIRLPQAIILSPTRELCIQITKDLQGFAKYLERVKITPVYGGANIVAQIKELKSGTNIIVATPGRLNDLINRKVAILSEIQTVILDEADEMLNMGFRDELDAILSNVPDTRHTWLFSATMPPEVAELARRFMKNPLEVTVGRKNAASDNITHTYYVISEKDRYLATKRILDAHPDIYSIIFCRTRIQTQEVASQLMSDGYNADSLHGDLSQAQRDYVMNKFRGRNLQILVATDVAARGLDVDDLTHIIHYHLPDDPEIYTHRSGRTGRAGKSGVSAVLINLKEKYKLKQVEKFINKPFEFVKVPSGSEICHKQLINLMNQLSQVSTDSPQLQKLLPALFEKFDHFTKEDLLTRVVALEFNRFFEYYKNARDINVEEPSRTRGERSFEDRKDRDRDRDRKFDRRDNDDRFGRDKKAKGDRFDKSRKGDHSRPVEDNYTRYFINLGKDDGIKPQTLLSLINDVTRNRKISIGRIDLFPKFSYFEVPSEYNEKILSSFKKLSIDGRKINVEVAK